MPNSMTGTERLTTVLAVLSTMSVILPAFLTGAMAVQVSAGLDLTESDIGIAIGVFFGGSAAGSAVLGRLAEGLGPRVAIRAGLAATIVANLLIATAVDDGGSLQLILIGAGLANAMTQPAINLLLVRLVEPDRLGLAMALKQSGMPAAALLGGLAVPAIALTIGWRSAFVFAAALALVAIGLSFGRGAELAPPRSRNAEGEGHRGPVTRGRPGATAGPGPDQTWAMLGLMAAVGVLGGGAANIMVGYLVSGAVAAGIAAAPAGLLLTLGSGLGIASRLANGWLADRGRFDVLTTVATLFAIGSLGALTLGIGRPVAYLIGTPIAFAAGWAWPGLFNLVVVQANRAAPAAATGVTQTGVYLGSLVSPVLAGVLIERSGYGAAWLLTAASLAGAAVLAVLVKIGMARAENPGVGPEVEPTGASR